ncbi:kinesin-like protein KIN-14S [Tanacetum coccineum]|uniref:Kinesin-like protein KIN-14S n=1 Tax=Tanacetum coccineum TaxID=301880 RepID=A0ABQ4YC79_9ASTR
MLQPSSSMPSCLSRYSSLPPTGPNGIRQTPLIQLAHPLHQPGFREEEVAAGAEVGIVTREEGDSGCSQRLTALNEVIEALRIIRCFCRCRPLNHDEVARGSTAVVDFDSSLENELDSLDKRCKTFTMEGTAENRGVNYRTLEELFRVSKERGGIMRYQLSVSMLEVYNEMIRDLLVKDTNQPAKKFGEGRISGLVSGIFMGWAGVSGGGMGIRGRRWEGLGGEGGRGLSYGEERMVKEICDVGIVCDLGLLNSKESVLENVCSWRGMGAWGVWGVGDGWGRGSIVALYAGVGA